MKSIGLAGSGGLAGPPEARSGPSGAALVGCASVMACGACGLFWWLGGAGPSKTSVFAHRVINASAIVANFAVWIAYYIWVADKRNCVSAVLAGNRHFWLDLVFEHPLLSLGQLVCVAR